VKVESVAFDGFADIEVVDLAHVKIEVTLYPSAGEAMHSFVVAASRAFFNLSHYGRFVTSVCPDRVRQIDTRSRVSRY
jgi:hypothetical protein